MISVQDFYFILETSHKCIVHTTIFFTSTEDRGVFDIDPPPPIATKEIIETELSF